MNQKSRIIHRVIERLNSRIDILLSIRDRLQVIADRYDEQDQDLKVPVARP